jgi:hypothetical protein
MLHYASGNYDVSEQYPIYDANSLFADVGGYLGLLLGQGRTSLTIFVICGSITLSGATLIPRNNETV